MNGLVTAIQPNGERIPLEYWVVRDFQRGRLNDEFLARYVRNAVTLYTFSYDGIRYL